MTLLDFDCVALDCYIVGVYEEYKEIDQFDCFNKDKIERYKDYVVTSISTYNENLLTINVGHP